MKTLIFSLLIVLVFCSCYTQIKFLSPEPEYYSYEDPYWYNDDYSNIYVSWQTHYIYDYWYPYDYYYPYYNYYCPYLYPHWNPWWNPWYQYYYWDDYYPYYYSNEYVAPKNYKKRDFNTRANIAPKSKTTKTEIKSRNKTESKPQETYKPRTVNRPQETYKPRTTPTKIKESNRTKKTEKVSNPPESRKPKADSKTESKPARSVKRK